MAPTLDRAAVFDDHTITGVELCRAYSNRVDAWLSDLYDIEVGDLPGVALVAVGGYGRAELSPQSDIDLLLLHDGRADVAEIAERIWYPIWDEGLKLGHAVRTPKEALSLAADDLDTATSLLSTRTVAGDREFATGLAEKALALWQKRAKRWLGELSATVRDRQARNGEVAFLLEPDLKDGRGGLRDVQAIRWAEMARTVMLEDDDEALADAYRTLLAARVELHRRTGRVDNRLLFEEQDAVAAALGFADADRMMRAISAAARQISWTSDEVWDRVESSLKGPFNLSFSRDRDLGDGIVLREGLVELRKGADPGADAVQLRVAVAAAQQGTRIERHTLNRLAEASRPLFEPWSDETRGLLVDLLGAGESALPVIESLDQRGIWTHILPEWEHVRFKPQRNAYHTFTVDRHLWQAAVNAAGVVDRVDRPDLLLIGALLHDIGKGFPGDHTEVGIKVVGHMAPRMGLPPDDVAVLQAMVRHHLLLPDIAVRRDLADPGTVAMVAEAVGSLSTLRLLDALVLADSLATGPAAWNSWKAELVAELVARTAHVLSGGAAEDVAGAPFPTDEQRARMAQRRRLVEGVDDRLEVIAPDRPGIFSRVAGALALNGLDVLEAAAHTESGMALETFRVQSSFRDPILWDRVIADIERALDGRLALNARLAERARLYRRRAPGSVSFTGPVVVVDNDISAAATVVEVRAPDDVGALYKITRAIAELDLDLRSAKVQTMAADVIDSFYVTRSDGGKITDSDHLGEIDRAIVHALAG